jgi:hypothetical protein
LLHNAPHAQAGNTYIGALLYICLSYMLRSYIAFSACPRPFRALPFFTNTLQGPGGLSVS